MIWFSKSYEAECMDKGYFRQVSRQYQLLTTQLITFVPEPNVLQSFEKMLS